MEKSVKQTPNDKKLLEYFAHYVWWENKDEIIAENPLRIIASAMKDANDDKSFKKVCEFSTPLLKETLKKAQAGWFDGKSWSFWHVWLYGANTKIPPIPKRGYLNEAAF